MDYNQTQFQDLDHRISVSFCSTLGEHSLELPLLLPSPMIASY